VRHFRCRRRHAVSRAAAGTYTPFLTILFPDNMLYSIVLLSVLWLIALVGSMVVVLYHGPAKLGLLISSYVGMGWAVLVCANEIYERMLPRPEGLVLLVGGGVVYTAGVYFNVKNRRTLGVPDHTIWHLFVMGGSALHYYCIYEYVLAFPYESDSPQPPALPAGAVELPTA